MENQETKSDNIATYLFIGFMFIGIGIGSAMGYDGMGVMVGMGVGFLAAAIYKAIKK